MATSDLIASFILNMLDDRNGVAELQRRTLADQFDCVPSQINYVISTRFSPEHGYIVESRRGGNGYIRIIRVRTDKKQLIMHIINAIGTAIDYKTAVAFISNAQDADALDEKTARLILSAIGDNALKPILFSDDRNTVRACILKQMLLHTISAS